LTAGLILACTGVFPPLSAPGSDAIGILSITGIWNDLLLGLAVSPHRVTRPVTVALSNLPGTTAVQSGFVTPRDAHPGDSRDLAPPVPVPLLRGCLPTLTADTPLRTESMDMSRISDLFNQQQQSVWLDSLSCSYFTDSYLQNLIDLGIRGLTSNPTLMANAIKADSAYDEPITRLASHGLDPEEMYWELVNDDVERAADLFLPVHSMSDGLDGYVSVEISPELAHDAQRSVQAAASLRARFSAPNILIKIPATMAGLQAIEDAIATGVSVNVTLIFSLSRYKAVLDAYVRGIERLVADGGDASHVHSVASFFVSRVDTEVDARLQGYIDQSGDQSAKDLLGSAAVAQAQLAYALFAEASAGWVGERLSAAGARAQRLLWASTSAKNPAYDRLLYVDPLIGPQTVNTMPEVTIRDFEAGGHVARTIDADVAAAHTVVQRLASLGIDLGQVAGALEERGVAAFRQSFSDVREQLRDKSCNLAA
jgi:transaldolase